MWRTWRAWLRKHAQWAKITAVGAAIAVCLLYGMRYFTVANYEGGTHRDLPPYRSGCYTDDMTPSSPWCSMPQSMQWTRFIWLATDSFPLKWSDGLIDVFRNHSFVYTLNTGRGHRYSHVLYRTWWSGKANDNLKTTPVTGDHLAHAMQRAPQQPFHLHYVGPEWSFLGIIAPSYRDTFEEVDFREEPLNVHLRHIYPFFFEDATARRNWTHTVDQLASKGQSLVTHSAVLDHYLHGEYKHHHGSKFPFGQKLAAGFIRDIASLRSWADRHPDYLIILSSDHGHDEEDPTTGAYRVHGTGARGNVGFVLFYNAQAFPAYSGTPVDMDVVDFCPTLAKYFRGVDIPADAVGLARNAYFGPDAAVARLRALQQSVAHLRWYARRHGLRSSVPEWKIEQFLSLDHHENTLVFDEANATILAERLKADVRLGVPRVPYLSLGAHLLLLLGGAVTMVVFTTPATLKSPSFLVAILLHIPLWSFAYFTFPSYGEAHAHAGIYLTWLVLCVVILFWTEIGIQREQSQRHTSLLGVALVLGFVQWLCTVFSYHHFADLVERLFGNLPMFMVRVVLSFSVPLILRVPVTLPSRVRLFRTGFATTLMVLVILFRCTADKNGWLTRTCGIHPIAALLYTLTILLVVTYLFSNWQLLHQVTLWALMATLHLLWLRDSFKMLITELFMFLYCEVLVPWQNSATGEVGWLISRMALDWAPFAHFYFLHSSVTLQMDPTAGAIGLRDYEVSHAMSSILMGLEHFAPFVVALLCEPPLAIVPHQQHRHQSAWTWYMDTASMLSCGFALRCLAAFRKTLPQRYDLMQQAYTVLLVLLCRLVCNLFSYMIAVIAGRPWVTLTKCTKCTEGTVTVTTV